MALGGWYSSQGLSVRSRICFWRDTTTFLSLRGIQDPDEPKTPFLRWRNSPASFSPRNTASPLPPELTLPGHMLVTKSLKAKLPKALALDGTLVDEGASGRL